MAKQYQLTNTLTAASALGQDATQIWDSVDNVNASRSEKMNLDEQRKYFLNMTATARLLGRFSAGAGPAEEGTASQVRAFLGLPTFYVDDYGAVGNGTTDDRVAIQNATNAAANAGGGVVYFTPGKTYNLVSTVTFHLLKAHITLQDKQNVTFWGPGATLKSSHAEGGATPVNLFYCDGCRNIKWDGFTIEGGYVRVVDDITVHGIGCFMVCALDRAAWNFEVRNIIANDVYFLWRSAGVAPYTNRVRNITIRNCYVDYGEYGIVLIEDGDNLHCTGLVTLDLRRTYFPYGCDNNYVEFTSVRNYGHSDILIKAYANDTTNIHVRGTVIDSDAPVAKVTIESQHPPATQPTPGKLRNITVEIDDMQSTGSESIRFAYYQDATETATSSVNLFDNIIIKGRIRNDITCLVTQTPLGKANLDDLQIAGVSAPNVSTNFWTKIGEPGRTYAGLAIYQNDKAIWFRNASGSDYAGYMHASTGNNLVVSAPLANLHLAAPIPAGEIDLITDNAVQAIVDASGINLTAGNQYKIGGTAVVSYGTIQVSGQTSLVASSTNAALTIAAGTNITLDTNGGVGPLTISATGGGSSNSFATIAVSGQSNVVADSSTDTLTLVAGTRLGITTDAGTDAITLNYPYTFATLTVDSATPSVSGIEAGQSANTAATTITNFTGGVTGQKFTYHINDANTGIADNANIALIGGQAIPASSSPRRVAFQYDGTQWQHLYTASDEHQFSQSVDGSNNLTLENAVTDADVTFKVNGTSGVLNLNVNGTDRVSVDNTSVTITGTLKLSTGTYLIYGTGSPEGAVTAPVSSQFFRTDGGTDTAHYRKESGAGNTGWVATTAGGGSGLPSGGSVGDLVVNTAPGAGAWSSVLSVGANRATITGGTVTASAPVITATQTWNSGAVTFDGIDLNVTNTASATGSRLINLRLGGTSQFQVTSTGAVRGVNGLASAPTYSFTGDTDTGMYYATNQINFAVGGSAQLTVTNAGAVTSSGNFIAPNGSSNTPTFKFATGNAGLAYDTGGERLMFIENGSPHLYVGRSSVNALQPFFAKRYIVASTAGVGSPNVITDVFTNSVLTNEGSTAKNYHTLPSAASGIMLTFVVQDADGLRVTAASGDTIRLGNKVTSAAGYVESTTIGDTVTLVSINATEWIMVSGYGTWTDGTFTWTDVSST